MKGISQSTSRGTNRRGGWICSLAMGFGTLMLSACMAPAQPAPGGPGATVPQAGPGQPLSGPSRSKQDLSGTVSGFNLGARGNIEGILLKSSDRTIQVNFPPDTGTFIAQSVHAGDEVHLSAIGEMSMPDHPVYTLVSLTDKDGKAINVPSPENRQSTHIEGTVQALNYGRRGEINGAILDSGDFVMVGPRGAEQLKLAVGQKLTIDGSASPMLQGHNVIEASKVNDVAIEHPMPPRRGPGQGGPMGMRPPGDGQGPDGQGGPGGRMGPPGEFGPGQGPGGPGGPGPMRGGENQPPRMPPQDGGQGGPNMQGPGGMPGPGGQ